MKLQNKRTDGRVVSRNHDGTQRITRTRERLRWGWHLSLTEWPGRGRQRGVLGGHPDTWDHQAVHDRQAWGTHQRWATGLACLPETPTGGTVVRCL